VKTEISIDVAAAVELLRHGEVVALPTETVYGLAADALDGKAVEKIFEAKGRPRFDPLIVHIPDPSWLQRVADIVTQDEQIVRRLMERFWPGPLTLVLPKRDLVPDIVTAGLPTIAVRLSAHPVFRQVIRRFGRPLAAPSANRFGRISPTAAAHVYDELNGRIPLILDGGDTEQGLESTIAAVADGRAEILRCGPVTEEQLREILPSISSNHRPEADATGQSGIGFQPMIPNAKVDIRTGAYLPHWTQTGATYAVTFRLADSLPINVLRKWKHERYEIVQRASQQKRKLTSAEEQTLAQLFSDKVERYLDAGHGSCALRQPEIAAVIRGALFHFDNTRYELFTWCVMPNHVHVIVRPMGEHMLSDILRSWKSFTARVANRLLKRTGEFWQRESYDHLIRNEDDFRHHIRYVLENPDKAGLKAWPWAGLRNHRPEADTTIVRAPGQLPSHYAPAKPLHLIANANEFAAKTNTAGLLAWRGVANPERFAVVRHLSPKQDVREAAANLFRYLRELDAADNVELILAERVPTAGLGAAIMDRLSRAANRGNGN
jgi:tRNA threonylcarbamoyl adenosine modification protein (Sua5/YciO/YrdC/YwlC family)